MTADPTAMLSKSKVVAGQQCPRRVWLQCREPELATTDASTRAILDAGIEVGLRAQ